MSSRVRLIERAPTPEQVREVAVTEAEFLVGRASDCNLRLVGTAVSRHHCIIRLAGGDATLVDLGSSNGTYLNGQRVRSQAALHSGDELRIGNTTFVVDLGDQDAIDLGISETDPAAATIRLPRKPEADKPTL
jgi:pSer/pThr/pTyr-binding forkhead associated (FHA) protein